MLEVQEPDTAGDYLGDLMNLVVRASPGPFTVVRGGRGRWQIVRAEAGYVVASVSRQRRRGAARRRRLWRLRPADAVPDPRGCRARARARARATLRQVRMRGLRAAALAVQLRRCGWRRGGLTALRRPPMTPLPVSERPA